MLKNIFRIFTLLLITILVAALFVSAAMADPPSGGAPRILGKYAGPSNIPIDTSDSSLDKKDLTAAEQKLSTSILQLVDDSFLPEGTTKKELLNQMKEYGQISTNISENASIQSLSGTNVHVYIKLNKGCSFDSISPYVTEIEDKDVSQGIAAAWIDINELEGLASLEAVNSIQEVMPPVVCSGSVDSEGDSMLKADLMRAQTGSDGTGVKIGIISNGVDHWTTARDKGDLPSNLTVLSNTVGGDEGTAMLEIVHDLAPGAQLYFHDSGNNTIAFCNAAADLAAEGCDIICDDLLWITEPFFEDGYVAQHIESLISSYGIIYCTSAGNEANNHYQGTYTDLGDGNHTADFSGNKSDPYMYEYLPSGATLQVIMEWNDAFGHSGNDYNLQLYNANTGALISGSYNVQNGYNDPIETILYNNSSGSDMVIRIRAYASTSSAVSSRKILEIYTYSNGGGMYADNRVTSDSIFGQAAAVDVISCGAIDANPNDNYQGRTCGQIEYFSCCGPVTMLSGTRQKPDICGADGVSITGTGGFENPFYGTSAAAPHVAAIVALLESRFSSMSVTQIKQMLLNNADDLGSTGYDNVYGSGRADALNAALSYLYVTFDSQDGSTVGGQLLQKGGKATRPPNPTKTGCVFGGWYTSIDFAPSHLWDFNNAVTADTKLYANWGQSGFTISSSGAYDLSSYGNGVTININPGLTVTLTGSSSVQYTGIQINCGAGVTLTINNLNIDDYYNIGLCPLSFTGSGNYLTITGYSNIRSSDDQPGIKVETGTSLEISGTGFVVASSYNNGAGIGGGNGKSCGNVTIAGGNVCGYGYNYAAGIGGGKNGSGGNISITGGTVITEGVYGAGIGGGNGGAGGMINISGGTVCADGYETPYDIGNGLGGTGGTFIISGEAAIFLTHGSSITPATTSHVLVSTNIIGDNYIVFGKIHYPYGSWSPPVYAYIDKTDLCYIHYKGIGTETETAPYYKDTTAVLKPNVTSGGQYLVGWNTKSDGTGKIYLPGTAIKVTGDIDLYAMWGQMFGGSGTQADPYRIGNAQQLIILSQLVNSGVQPYQSSYYIQTADINLSAYDNWAPIGTFNSYSFSGTYDGNQKQITGMKINIPESDWIYVGLFGNLNGNVKNLTMNGGSVSVAGASTIYAGGIAGYVNSGTVLNCSSSVNLSVSSEGNYTDVGGIAGCPTNSTISGCSNSGSVNVSADYGQAGGIAGAGGQIIGCSNSGNICAQGNEANSGGITGAYGNITSCSNSGEISIVNASSMATCGGITGYAYYNDITGCSNFGNLIAENCKNSVYCGGILGFCSSNVNISGCGNSGKLSVENPVFVCEYGGIAGGATSYSNIAITGCYNTGNISIVSPTVWTSSGGIIGDAAYATISKCYNTGNLSTTLPHQYTYSGGIVGYDTSSSSYRLSITDCFNNGNISGRDNGSYKAYVGGIIGSGDNTYTTAARCYNTGLVTGDSYFGGFAGYIFGSTSTAFTNCYYANTCSKGIGFGTGTVAGKTPSELKQHATFSGFDFNNIWNIIEGSRYPVLRGTPFTYVTGISVVNKLGIDVGSQKTLSYTILPSGASDKNVTWTSSNPSLALVDKNGLVSLLADGSATVTATTDDGNFAASCIVLTRIQVTSVTLDKNSLQMVHHDAGKLTASVLPENATYPEVAWTSSDETVAVVDQSGNVTAIGIGNAVITATAEKTISDSCSIEVTPKHVINITLSGITGPIIDGDTGKLTADLEPADATYPQITWTSSDESAATVDQNGKVNAVFPGSATITATADNISGTYNVTVTPKRVTSVTINNNSIIMLLGDCTALTADVEPADATYPAVKWTSSDESVATVDQDGKVTAKGWGNTTIKAEADGKSYTCSVKVNVQFKVVFNTNGGSTVSAQTANYTELVKNPGNPSRTGYDFAGWYQNNGTFETPWNFVSDTMPYNDLNLYAKWDAKKYTLTFNPGYGAKVSPSSMQVSYGSEYGDLPSPTKFGYYFYGWYTGANGAGTLIRDNDTVTLSGGITLYAKWVKNSSIALKTPSLIVKAINYKTVTLTLKAIANAQGYEIYKKIGKTYIRIDTVNVLSYTETGLDAGVKHYYEVRAYRVPYLTTVYSSYSSAKYAEPVWPSITLKATAQNNNTIALSWDAIAGATGYGIWRCETSRGTYIHIADAYSTSYSDGSCSTGKTYYYKVQAYDSSGAKPLYSPLCGYKYAKTVPDTPANLTLSQLTSGGITVSWNATGGAMYYEIYRATSLKGSYKRITTISETNYTDTGITAGKTYYYKVRAYTIVGGTVRVYGGYSSVISLKI